MGGASVKILRLKRVKVWLYFTAKDSDQSEVYDAPKIMTVVMAMKYVFTLASVKRIFNILGTFQLSSSPCGIASLFLNVSCFIRLHWTGTVSKVPVQHRIQSEHPVNSTFPEIKTCMVKTNVLLYSKTTLSLCKQQRRFIWLPRCFGFHDTFWKYPQASAQLKEQLF